MLKLTGIVTHRGKKSREVRYAVTSLPPERASPARLLNMWRGHWGIENRLHWVRDTEFREDKCRVKDPTAGQNLAAFRNAAIGLIRLSGARQIAPKLRHFARHARKLLEFVTT